MPKITELNAITSVANNDLLMVVHDPAGLPSTNKITVSNFGTSITNNLNYANNTTKGVIKVGEYLSVNSTGFLNVTGGAGGAEGVYPLTSVTSNNYTVSNTDVIIFADPNSIDEDIRIILPTVNISTGQEFLIKNINPGANHKVTVITDAGIQSGSNYLENPVTGEFIVSYEIGSKGESHTWIYDGGTYRHLAELSSSPVFYASTDSFHQVVATNPSAANNASTDWVAYNNEGNYVEGTGPFVDMGINSNTYSDTSYGNVWGPSDAYLYNYGGNLIVGPQTDHSIKFLAGNTNTENVKLVVNTSAIYINSNIRSLSNSFDIKTPVAANTKYAISYYDQNEWGGYVQLDQPDGNSSWAWVGTDIGNINDPYVVLEARADNGNYGSWYFRADGVLSLPAGIGDIKRDGVSVLGTGQIDGGDAFTTPTAEITVDGGGA